MAFFHLQKMGRVNPGVHYSIIHSANRRIWERRLRPYFEGMPPGYSEHQEYVLLWTQGPAWKPYLDAELIEAFEFIAAANAEARGVGA